MPPNTSRCVRAHTALSPTTSEETPFHFTLFRAGPRPGSMVETIILSGRECCPTRRLVRRSRSFDSFVPRALGWLPSDSIKGHLSFSESQGVYPLLHGRSGGLRYVHFARAFGLDRFQGLRQALGAPSEAFNVDQHNTIHSFTIHRGFCAVREAIVSPPPAPTCRSLRAFGALRDKSLVEQQ